ncbi:MAG: hypothetical protein PHE56_07210, partial [Bacteroidales bacterium]|nr:hypothetical protein [Bacteroidales bacterium]
MAKQNKPLTPAEMQRANDKMMEELGKMKFESIEEVQAFINQNINGKILSNPSIKKKGPKSNIEKSEDLYYKALEAPSLKKAQTLLNQALELNPENVVAITKHGELCENIEDAIEYFKNAMEIGAKCLGEEFFEKERGHFWGWHHTRPYMTAKLNYAEALSITGKNTEAIENFMEMLELNPNDNQGVRYLLSTLLLTEKKWGDFLKLYNEYDEDSAYLNYNYLLYLLAREGASSRARKAYLDRK